MNTEDDKIQEDWGSWKKAEEWRKESFLRRSPAQRLRWLKEALSLAYLSGALRIDPPAEKPETPESSAKTGTPET